MMRLIASVLLCLAGSAGAAAQQKPLLILEVAPKVYVAFDLETYQVLERPVVVQKLEVPDSRNPYPSPPQKLREAVGTILDQAVEKQDADKIARVASRAAEKVTSEGSIDTTGKLRQWLVDELTALGLQGRYPTLGREVDGALDAMIGTFEDRELRSIAWEDSEGVLHPPDDDAFLAVAWALWEAGHE